MRTQAGVLALLFIAASTLNAQEADPDQRVSGGGDLPTGWAVRTDRGTNMDQIKFVSMGGGYHVTLGPRTIFYRPADAVEGSYRVSATMVQTKAPSHSEAYGLFIGGSDLQGAGQEYSYFLIRGDGKFLIKNREGAGTSSISGSWTSHSGIRAQDADGKSANTLTVEVGDGQVRFLVNDEEVYAGSADQFRTSGIAGLRVNHNLDIHIDGFTVEGG